MEKLFGKNSAFTATMEMEQQGMTLPGKMAFDQGKSRFEMDMSQSRGKNMGPEMAAQMKAMGMGKTVVISRPDKKVSYMIYPDMNAYVETPLEEPSTGTETKAPANDYKVNVTKLGTDTVDGLETTKNKVVVTDASGGQQYEATVWNAKDLKDFPVKIQHSMGGQQGTIHYKDVKLGKPDAGQFEPPTNFKKYASMQELMQQEVMKRMGMPGGMPPGGATPPRPR